LPLRRRIGRSPSGALVTSWRADACRCVPMRADACRCVPMRADACRCVPMRADACRSGRETGTRAAAIGEAAASRGR
jgi:hypothetical protein